jgi:ABC-type bacteriocin/lantibiotic exporter with double-glycine peptidase domain
MYELGNSFENILALILGISFLLLFSLLIATIIHKAGYHWAWVFIWFVPLINLIFYIIFALKKWPIQERLEECQRENREIQKALMGSIQKT